MTKFSITKEGWYTLLIKVNVKLLRNHDRGRGVFSIYLVFYIFKDAAQTSKDRSKRRESHLLWDNTLGKDSLALSLFRVNNKRILQIEFYPSSPSLNFCVLSNLRNMQFFRNDEDNEETYHFTFFASRRSKVKEPRLNFCLDAGYLKKKKFTR